MINVEILLLSLLMLSVSSCESFPPPKTEVCITLENPGMGCSDPRLPDDDRNYDRDYTSSYVCTNPSDYQIMFAYCSDLREELIRCKRGNK